MDLNKLSKQQLIDIALDKNIKISRKHNTQDIIKLLNENMRKRPDLTDMIDPLKYKTIEFMDYETIRNLSLTNKEYHKIYDTMETYKYLLERDFGITEIDQSTEKYKDVYIDYYNKFNDGDYLFASYQIKILIIL